MVDITTVHNPYDFSNPVLDNELFAGRKNQLQEINYYLNHASQAPRPINLALLGRRASGKTSILNIIENEAKKLEFCSVRVDLDEGDAQTQLVFFHKLFDSILLEACQLGAFGGLNGKTYQTYLDIMYAYAIPEDKTFCPFLFPIQYAKSVSCGNNDSQIADNVFKRDLVTIQNELNKPIIILFDECNVLSEKRIHLEKIRNIFMNISGFMLVFTGTPELFPVIDDIFSPIIRQFKKINVGDFEDKKETQECIIKPLEKIGINPKKILDVETYSDIAEIHNLSGGRPYEIQLICHLLFRRVQQKRAKTMKLDLSILEDVRKELVTSQALSNRPIISNIKKFNKKELSALSLICKSNEKLNFEQLWLVEYIFNGGKEWSKYSLEKLVDTFVQEKIFYIEDGIIKFFGDEFDKIYIKYYAREQGIYINFSDASLNFSLNANIRYLTKKIGGLNSISSGERSEVDLDISKVIDKLASKNTNEDIFVEVPANLIKDLYFLMLHYRNNHTVSILKVKFVLPWLTCEYWYYSVKADSTEILGAYIYELELVKKRIAEISTGDLLLELKNVTVIPVELLIQKVNSTANQPLKYLIYIEHSQKAVESYLSKVENTDAFFHANLAYEYLTNNNFFATGDFLPFMAINLGYLFMINNEYTKARSILEKYLQQNVSTNKHNFPLAHYDLGVLALKEDNPEEALHRFNLCIEVFNELDIKDSQCTCLLAVNVENEELVIREVTGKDAELIAVALNSKKALEKFLQD